MSEAGSFTVFTSLAKGASNGCAFPQQVDEELAKYLQYDATQGRAVRKLCKGSVVCLGGYCSVLLLLCFMWSSALESPGLLLSYSMITVALHNTIILIIS